MTEEPEGQTPRPDQQPPADWRTGAPASSVIAEPPAYPPVYAPPGYAQPPAYPPPPEYYQQGAQRPASPAYPPGYGQIPAYPPYPNYPPYPPQYPQGYGQYPGEYPGQYPPPYPYPQQYEPYAAPGYAPQQAASAAADVADTRVHLFWPIVSAIVSFAVYAMLLGWQFGLGFMALLLIHEMGHFVVIRAKGLPAGLPIFIPLLGAFVTMRRAPLGVRDEAEIALAGPLAGAVGGVVCLIAYWQTGLPVLLPLAYFSFYINLLNLIPVGPLDGARITGAISKWIWPIGLAGVALGAWYTHDPLLIILGIFGAYQLVARFTEAGKSSYYAISAGARVFITLTYFGLAAVLAYATFTIQPLMAARGTFF